MMKKRYYAFLPLCLLLIVGTAQGQGTENFDAQANATTSFSANGANWLGSGARAGQVATIGATQFLSTTPNGWRTNASGSTEVTFDAGTNINNVTFFFVHAGGGSGTAEAFSDATCTTAIGGTTVNSNNATTQGDVANFETIDSGGTAIRCIVFTNTGTVPTVVDDFEFSSTLPVELVSFNALADGDAVNLRWETASEDNNSGFEVQHVVNNQFQAVAFVDGNGTTSTGASYSHEVVNLAPGTHVFRLRQIDFDGTSHYSTSIEVDVEMPGAFHLSPAFPNPFNPQTNFTLTVERTQAVRIEVYDLLGRRVAELFNGSLEADEARQFTFEASNLSSGIYLIRAIGENFTTARQVTLLK